MPNKFKLDFALGGGAKPEAAASSIAKSTLKDSRKGSRKGSDQQPEQQSDSELDALERYSNGCAKSTFEYRT